MEGTSSNALSFVTPTFPGQMRNSVVLVLVIVCSSRLFSFFFKAILFFFETNLKKKTTDIQYRAEFSVRFPANVCLT